MIAAILFTCLVGLAACQTVPCGTPKVSPAVKRIVGGKEATPGSWPWMVMIVDDLGYISGSGAIVGSHAILTSAQHFEGADYHLADVNTQAWNLFLGSHNINTDDLHEKNYTIASVTVNPNFDTNSLANDIAIIFTNEPIVYNDHTSPLCLPDPTHLYQINQTCYLAGWGSTSNTGNEDVLNQVDLPIIDPKDCQQHYSDFIPDKELCAGYETGYGKDFCADDIGSPLMCKDASTGVWYTQGIASSGGDCTQADEPAIFEDVSKFIPWVRAAMAKAGHPYEY